MKKQNKKGFLLGEQTLKIIIAVLCIALLVFLLFKIYSSYVNEKYLDQARASLENIKNSLLEAKETGQSELLILNPTDVGSILNINFRDQYWWIISFPLNSGVKPRKCSLQGWENCLCICSSNFGLTGQGAAGECDNLGTCINTESRVELVENRITHWIDAIKDNFFRPYPIILVDPPIKLIIKFENNKFTIYAEK